MVFKSIDDIEQALRDQKISHVEAQWLSSFFRCQPRQTPIRLDGEYLHSEHGPPKKVRRALDYVAPAKRRFVSAGDGKSKWVLESQSEADSQEPTESATVTTLRAKVAELEGIIKEISAELELCERAHCDDRD